MTLNKKCFYKSLKNDFFDVGKYVLAILGLCFGGWIGATYSNLIISLMPTFSASGIAAIFVICATLGGLYDIAFLTTKSQIVNKSTELVICVYICINAFILFLFAGAYAFIINGMSAKIQSDLMLSFMYDCWILLVITSVVYTIGIPIALAYVRCKDETVVE
jgi:hypothetical protein